MTGTWSVQFLYLAANVSSSETHSSSEDSASEDSSIDPINVAKARGADIKSLKRLRL